MRRKRYELFCPYCGKQLVADVAQTGSAMAAIPYIGADGNLRVDANPLLSKIGCHNCGLVCDLESGTKEYALLDQDTLLKLWYRSLWYGWKKGIPLEKARTRSNWDFIMGCTPL